MLHSILILTAFVTYLNASSLPHGHPGELNDNIGMIEYVASADEVTSNTDMADYAASTDEVTSNTDMATNTASEFASATLPSIFENDQQPPNKVGAQPDIFKSLNLKDMLVRLGNAVKTGDAFLVTDDASLLVELPRRRKRLQSSVPIAALEQNSLLALKVQSLGFYTKFIQGDGNCLFRALSDQLYGSQNRHIELRYMVVNYMRQNRDTFAQYIAGKNQDVGDFGTIEEHIVQMSRVNVWASQLEILAFAMLFQVDVYVYKEDLVSSIMEVYDPSKKVLHIAHMYGNHYESVRRIRDDHVPTPEDGIVPYNSGLPATQQELSIMDITENNNLPRIRQMMSKLGATSESVIISLLKN